MTIDKNGVSEEEFCSSVSAAFSYAFGRIW